MKTEFEALDTPYRGVCDIMKRLGKIGKEAWLSGVLVLFASI